MQEEGAAVVQRGDVPTGPPLLCVSHSVDRSRLALLTIPRDFGRRASPALVVYVFMLASLSAVPI